jgi:ADP-L-glycero-D-manno-heptose 6-epimerase
MYVVTGGAGFIGSNMAAAIEEAGLGRVAVCDRLRDGIKWRNIAKRDLFDIVHPDRLLDFLDIHAAAVKAIIHMGAISATTETDADRIVDNNFRLSVALWRWCTARQVPLIYASSAATYGDGKQGFSDDSSPAHLATLRPLNAYGWSKHLFDRWIVHNLKDGEPSPPQWAGLKFFNVYGPNEAHKGSMKSVIAQIHPTVKAGGTCKLFKSHRPDYEDGGQLRDFVWIGDCVDVMMWLLDNPQASGLFNCGTGQARSFKDLATATYRALGMEPKIEYIPTPEQIRDKYQYFTQADMSRLRDAGYDKPFTPLEEGVARYVKDYLDAEDPFR